jgi:DNA mismatch repair protein MutL
MLRHAVIDGMQGFLMKGRSPAGVIRLQLDPGLLDVNVHPAKREIRFRNQQQVHVFVSAAVRAAVAAYQETLRDSLFARRAAAQAGGPGTGKTLPPQVREPDTDTDSSAAPRQQRIMTGPSAAGSPSTTAAVEPNSTTDPCSCPPQDKKQIQPGPAAPDKGENAGESTFSGLRLIGQLMELYLLCERDNHLVVIDQHAAHERILFGRLAEAYLKQQIPVQHLLFPVSVELAPEQYERLGRRQPELIRLGLDVAEFGDNTAVIKGVPAAISRLDPEEILCDTLTAMKSSARLEPDGLPRSLTSLFASLACKAAIKAGNTLLPEEMLALLAQMEQSPVFSHCPHGRPVIKTFSRGDIERWFHRL